MLYAPKDLPRGEDAVIDPALAKISSWKYPQLDKNGPSNDASANIAFVREHRKKIFSGFRKALTQFFK